MILQKYFYIEHAADLYSRLLHLLKTKTSHILLIKLYAFSPATLGHLSVLQLILIKLYVRYHSALRLFLVQQNE